RDLKKHHQLISILSVTKRTLANVVKPSLTRTSFILLGASGDLANHEIYPSLWYLYRDNRLPNNTKIFGYARRKRTINDLRKSVEPYVTVNPREKKLYDEFWSLNAYISGSGTEDADYETIRKAIDEFEDGAEGNRLFYLAIPPTVFMNATSQIKRVAMAKTGWTRIVVEKPFGHDSESANKLNQHLRKLFTEDQIYRNDHFLNYEMVQNIFSLRFANRLLAPAWNKENIAAVAIDLKENVNIEGHGASFDKTNFIRDVMQNHLLQMMSLIAMERPKSKNPDDVRDAKVQFLKSVRKIVIDDVVLGQYVANPDSKDPRARVGYRDESSVPDDSITASFALTVLRVDSKRWRNVPFILRAGKAMNLNQTQIIIQFKDVEAGMFDNQPKRNELILTVKGIEGLQAKMTSKVPGYSSELEEINLDFKYAEEHKGFRIPLAFEKSIFYVFQGAQSKFVRFEEIKEAWRIFTPVLREIEGKKIRPLAYKFGSTGPIEAEEMEKRNNFLRD
ncbi:glucose-6-phosphate 1-dehydrogenase-like, partial [Phymastichus coffea]|uniref:glucose-6-phosphate 1-dehydrogenase-like n=1 Tax=Phymastichus coffea TaxID=108790 RepID=UPI00273A85D7